MMLTRADAEALGWEFTIEGENGRACLYAAGDTEREEPLDAVEAASATPIFALLANIAERRGEGFVVGYGGTTEATAELVASCSGETYTPPPAPEPALAPLPYRLHGALSALPVDTDAPTLRETVLGELAKEPGIA